MLHEKAGELNACLDETRQLQLAVEAMAMSKEIIQIMQNLRKWNRTNAYSLLC
jgi:hypothetical protein